MFFTWRRLSNERFYCLTVLWRLPVARMNMGLAEVGSSRLTEALRIAHPTGTLSIIVSSTFHDLKEERNASQDKVFSCLRGLYLQHEACFQAINLRCGAREETEVDQRTLRRGENAPLRV